MSSSLPSEAGASGTSPRVTVVIPNWNGRRFLDVCLRSLREQTFRDFRTLLVDNGSEDESLQFVSRRYPEVSVLTLGSNQGFAAAVNAGIVNSRSELVAPLNSDTEAEPGWLEALVRASDGYPEAGFFASKLLDFRDCRVLDGAGDAIRRNGLPHRLGHGELDRGQYDEMAYVFGACAAAAMYRRRMLEEIGLFDHDFFAYCEDADLSFRAQLAGCGCLYVPGAVVYHLGGGATGGKRSAQATRLGTRNSISMLVKNLPFSMVPRMAPWVLAGQVSRLFLAAVTSTLRAHLAGLAEALAVLPLMLEKRREIQKRRRVSDEHIRGLLRTSARMADASLLRWSRDRFRRKLEG